MKNVLIILAIMLITLCPTQGRRIKRKRDFGMAITGFYIASLVALTLKGFVKQWKYTNKFKATYDSLLQDFKEKEDYMIEKIDECRKLATVKDYILTTITKIVEISLRNDQDHVNQGECKEIVARLVQNPNQPNEIKENQVKCLDNQIKRDIRSVFGEIARLIGTEAKSSCDSEIFPFFDSLNSIMIQKKQILAEIKSKLSDTLTLYKWWRHDYLKMANTVNFGSANEEPTSITKRTVYNFLKSWLKTSITTGVTTSANLVAITGGTTTTPFVISLFSFELIGALGNVADSFGLFNRLKKFSFSSLVTNTLKVSIFDSSKVPILSVQKAAFFSYLSKNLILINIQQLGQIPGELSKLLPEQNMNRIEPIHDIDSSVAFRQMVTNKAKNNVDINEDSIQARFGLYFTEIAVSYSLEEARLMFKSGFEILSWFKKHELFVLGNRFNDNSSVLLHYELIPFNQADIKPEEIGSDYKGFLSNKLKPLIRVKLFHYFDAYCTNPNIHDSDIYNLATMAEVDVKLTKEHYLVSLMIRKDKYDSDEFIDYVNCFNKYKKQDNTGKIRICKRDNDTVQHLCTKGHYPEIDMAEIHDYIKSSNVYNLFQTGSKSVLEKDFPQAEIKEFQQANLMHHPKITNFSNEADNRIPSILCEELEGYKYREHAIKLFYGGNWFKPESITKSEKELKIKFENENSKIIFPEVEKNVHATIFYRNKEVIRYRHLLMIDKNGDRFLPITDFVHNVLNKRVDQLNDKEVTLKPIENYIQMPFKEIFTGFYHKNDTCKQYSSLALNAYLSPILKEIKWKDNETIAEAFKIDEDHRDHKQTIQNGYKHFYLSNINNRVPFHQHSFGQRVINEFAIHNFAKITESLKECSFASLAYEVTFEDETIKNPKIVIYPLEKDFKVSLVENLNEEFIYSKDLAITYTLIDVEQEADEKSDLNKFEVIANVERKYISFGYKKVEDFDGESDFKIYFPDKKKYIMVNFWSKLDLSKIKENAEKSVSQCNSAPINEMRENIGELNNQAENRSQRRNSYEIGHRSLDLSKPDEEEGEESQNQPENKDVARKRRNSNDYGNRKHQKPLKIEMKPIELKEDSNKEELGKSKAVKKSKRKLGFPKKVTSKNDSSDKESPQMFDKEKQSLLKNN